MPGTLTDRPGGPAPARGRPDVAVRLRPVAAGRRPVLALAAGLVVLVSTAVVIEEFQAAGRTVAVAEVTHTLSPGDTLQADDLSSVRVHVPAGVAVVRAAAADLLVGRPVSARLPAGSLLAPGDVGVAGPAPGSAVVGLAVAPGQAPAGGVSDGQHVEVVVTAPASGVGAAPSTGTAASDVPAPGTVVVADAPVVDVAPGSSTGSTVVSIVVPTAQAPLVAELSAAGTAALVSVPG